MKSPERIALSSLENENRENSCRQIASRIAAGAVFIYPTETIYGIGGRYDRKDVFKRIIKIKERASEHPMILIGGSLSSFDTLGLVLSPSAKKCAETFWPGPLTIVLPSRQFPDGIAIRVSDHPFLALIEQYFPVPFFSTSANISGSSYNPDPDVIYNLLGPHVDFMVDAGLLPPSQPSTVIKIENDDRITVLREGCIPAWELLAVIDDGK